MDETPRHLTHIKEIMLRKLLSAIAALALSTGLLVAVNQLPASAGGTYVQAGDSQDQTGAGNTQGALLTHATAGDLVVVYASWNDTSTTSAVNDGHGHNYTSISADSWGPSGGYRQQVWYYQNAPSNMQVANITFSGTPSDVNTVVMEFSGIATSGALDNFSHGAGTSNSLPNPPPRWSYGPFTKGTSTDLAVGFGSLDGANTNCFGSNCHVTGSSESVYEADTSNSSSAAQVGGVTTTNSLPWGAYQIAFKV